MAICIARSVQLSCPDDVGSVKLSAGAVTNSMSYCHNWLSHLPRWMCSVLTYSLLQVCPFFQRTMSSFSWEMFHYSSFHKSMKLKEWHITEHCHFRSPPTAIIQFKMYTQSLQVETILPMCALDSIKFIVASFVCSKQIELSFWQCLSFVICPIVKMLFSFSGLPSTNKVSLFCLCMASFTK